jgi:putative transposase
MMSSCLENLQMKKRFTEEQIIGILRESERHGPEIRTLVRRHNVTQQTFYRWRNKCGGMDVSDARKLKVLEAESAKLKKMVAEQLLALDAMKEFSRGLSQRSACRLLGLSHRVACYQLRQPQKDQAAGEELIQTSQRHPRFGYRRAAAWLQLGEARTNLLWRQLGLQLPMRRPRRRRCESCIRVHAAQQPNAVWTHDFVHDQLASGAQLKMLCVLDENSRECLGIEVARWLRSQDVILVLSRLMKIYGKPKYIRSDNSAEFTAAAVMRWLRHQNIGPAFISSGSPWQNGFVDSFNSKLRDECLNRE